jgi:3-oxoacyl-[acyl-carrier protein] reductase
MGGTSTDADNANGYGIPSGLRVVVVGGSGGIGSTLCARLTDSGARVASADTPIAVADRGVPEGAEPISIDVTDAESVAEAVRRTEDLWGGLDALVYVSGVGDRPTPIVEVSEAQWDRVFEVNLKGAFLVARAFAPLLSSSGEAGKSAMTFISSGLALNVEPGFGAYGASKAGLIALAKVLAKELAPEVRVNVVAPGMVQTPFLLGGTGQDRRNAPGYAEHFNREMSRQTSSAIPLGRIAEPEDIVGAVLFLSGPGARFMTGQTIHVNGGRYMP